MRPYSPPPAPPVTRRWGDPAPAAPEPSPGPMAFHETQRVRAAAHQAKVRYPGPVGELVNHELLTWADFGYRVGSHGLVGRLVTDLMRPSPR